MDYFYFMQKTMGICFPTRNFFNERLYIFVILKESRFKGWIYKYCCSEFILFQMQLEIHLSFQKITHQFSSKGFHFRMNIGQFSEISLSVLNIRIRLPSYETSWSNQQSTKCTFYGTNK